MSCKTSKRNYIQIIFSTHLTGSSGPDTFEFQLGYDGGVDQITDFNRREGDRILVKNWGVGVVTHANFDYFQDTGQLFYGSQHLATLTSRPDFILNVDLVIINY